MFLQNTDVISSILERLDWLEKVNEDQAKFNEYQDKVIQEQGKVITELTQDLREEKRMNEEQDKIIKVNIQTK